MIFLDFFQIGVDPPPPTHPTLALFWKLFDKKSENSLKNTKKYYAYYILDRK